LNDPFHIVSTLRRFAVQPATILTGAGLFTLEIGHSYSIQVMEKNDVTVLPRRFRYKVTLLFQFRDIRVV
jgi:hypothetical protein